MPYDMSRLTHRALRPCTNVVVLCVVPWLHADCSVVVVEQQTMNVMSTANQNSRNGVIPTSPKHSGGGGVTSTTTNNNNADQLAFHMHPHWQKYVETISSTPDALRIAIGLFILLLCVVGVTGNVTAILIFLRSPKLQKPSSLLVFNLAVSDLTFSLILGFPLISVVSSDRIWLWGDAGCSLYGFTGGLCGLNSINSLTLISVDRYLAISSPLKYKNRMTRLRAIQMMGLSWFWAFVWAVPPLLGWSRYVAEGLQISCTFDYLTRSTANIVYNYCLVGFGFVLPLTIIVVCYVGIVRSVKQNHMELIQLEVLLDYECQKHEKQSAKQELKLAKIAALMVTFFVLSWLPYAVIAQLGITGYQEYVTPYASQFPVILAKSSAIWNPIVYSLVHPKYKAALATRLPELLRLVCCSRNETVRHERSGSSKTTADV